jgi:hypothetical protein
LDFVNDNQLIAVLFQKESGVLLELADIFQTFQVKVLDVLSNLAHEHFGQRGFPDLSGPHESNSREKRQVS